MNEIHGKRVKITIDDDPNYYYLGRVKVNEWESDKATATIVLTAEVEPYKYQRHGEGRKL
jgi:phage-related protein